MLELHSMCEGPVCPRCRRPYFFSLAEQRDADPSTLCWAMPSRKPSPETLLECYEVAEAHRAHARDERQSQVSEWVRAQFGEACATDTRERVKRVLEEAVELAQAEGVPIEECEALLRHVFAKPVGEVVQEVGGASVTLLAYCAARGLSAEEQEVAEVERIHGLSRDYFRERHARKAQAGGAMPLGEE